MYKVFPVEGGFQIFWCPSAPHHYNDKVAYIDTKNIGKNGIYTKRQAAYRRMAELNRKEKEQETIKDALDTISRTSSYDFRIEPEEHKPPPFQLRAH